MALGSALSPLCFPGSAAWQPQSVLVAQQRPLRDPSDGSERGSNDKRTVPLTSPHCVTCIHLKWKFSMVPARVGLQALLTESAGRQRTKSEPGSHWAPWGVTAACLLSPVPPVPSGQFPEEARPLSTFSCSPVRHVHELPGPLHGGEARGCSLPAGVPIPRPLTRERLWG